MQNFLNMDVIITLIVWIVFSFIVMSYASSKGRSGCGWFIFSIMFSPLIGFIIVAILGETDEQHIETLKKDMAVTEALEKEKSEKEGMTQDKAIAELKKAKDLLDLAVITQEEYDAKKAELLPWLKGEVSSSETNPEEGNASNTNTKNMYYNPGMYI